MTEKQNQLSQQEQMVRGAAWLTIGNFLSRLLGAIYIIPWYAWMGRFGAQANALFGMGYNIYALFLLVSTVGIPVAVAKQVAKYNTKNQKDTSFYLIREFLKLMLLLGAIFALAMYVFSPLMAAWSGGGEDLVRVMRSLTLAVLVFPAMSVLRGFFQGFNNLKPYAVSQIAEQLIRVIWMLLTAFYIMKLGSGNYVEAVTQSTFAAFIGMLASIAVLIYFLWKEKMLSRVFSKKPDHVTVDTKSLVIETTKEAIPFVVTGSAVQIFQIIDQWTFSNTMSLFTNYSKASLDIMFAYFAANPNKLTMILIAVATAVSGTGIPLLTENFVKKDKKAAAHLVINNIQMLTMFLLPAILGSVILAKPLYTIFYGQSDQLALNLFIAALIQTLFLAFYTLFSPMLQALFENRKALIYFAYGLIVKLVLQIPCIYLLQAYGPLLATAIGLLVPIVLSYKQIHKVTSFSQTIVFRSNLLIAILTLLMGLLVALVTWGLGLVLSPDGRINSMIYILLVGTVGVAFYGYLTLKTRLLDKMLGSRAAALRKTFRIS
ncbi:putative polysaccharide biosynthesis protein [Streptococcus ferus]|uniref:putative polysaccharide biosynthesis protein n=1 Tax=Streptococcus ferus TaxID=1345 RepID=UPI0023550891|nr:polysaccharide biosynthesis protein [Streptococcus ferus]